MPWVTCPSCNGQDVWRKCPQCNGRCSIGRDRHGNDIPCTLCVGGEVVTPCTKCNGVGQQFVKD